MFVRLKKIKGNFYAYHVENKRINGKVKQTSKKYLGKAIIPKKHRSQDFNDFIKKDYKEYSKKDYKKIIFDLIKFELDNYNLVKIDVNLEKPIIEKDNMPVVIKLNDGFLYSQTIKNLLDFKPANDDNYLVGKEFAELFVKAGINIPKELFVELFEKMTKS